MSTLWYKQAEHLSSASLHEAAGRIGALPASIKPHASLMRVCGTVFPVQCVPGDNLWLHRAVYAASANDVIVATVTGAKEFGYWGDLLSHAAQLHGLAGLVIDGGVRDSQTILAMGFPVFSNGICICGTTKDPQGKGTLGLPIQIGAVTIHHGDLVLGDADGVVVIPQTLAADAIAQAQKRDAQEIEIRQRLQRGERTLDILNIPEH